MVHQKDVIIVFIYKQTLATFKKLFLFTKRNGLVLLFRRILTHKNMILCIFSYDH